MQGFFAFPFPQFSFHQGLLVQLAGNRLVFFFLMSGMMNTKTPDAEVHGKSWDFTPRDMINDSGKSSRVEEWVGYF